MTMSNFGIKPSHIVFFDLGLTSIHYLHHGPFLLARDAREICHRAVAQESKFHLKNFSLHSDDRVETRAISAQTAR